MKNIDYMDNREDIIKRISEKHKRYIIIELTLQGLGTPHIVDYQDKQMRDKLEKAKEIVIKEERITFHYRYPLNNHYTFPHIKKGGFTRIDVFRSIYEDYQIFYGGKRKYGVYGHYLEELVIEEIKYYPYSKMVVLSIGS